MQPLLSLLASVVLCNHQGFPANPFLPTMRALGEAESGSAGTQPDKE